MTTRRAGNAVRVAVRSLGELDRPHGFDDPDELASFGENRLRAFRENPCRGSDEDPAQLLALLGDRVVGRVDVFRGQASAFGETTPLFWGSSLHVPAELRTTGAGVMLVLRMSTLGSTVAGCGFSQAAVPIYQALRWQSFEFRRWILVRRSRPVVERLMTPVPPSLRVPLSAAAAFGADRLLSAERAARSLRVRGSRALTARAVESLSPALDARLASPDAEIFTHRSSQYLQWQLQATFADGYTQGPERRLFVAEDENGAVAGYFVVKVKRHEVASQRGYRNLLLGSVQDWFLFATRPGLLQTIVLLAIDELSRMHVDAIEICETEPGLGDVARRLGFRRAGTTHFMFRPTPDSALARPESSDRAAWRLTPAEGDTMFG